MAHVDIICPRDMMPECMHDSGCGYIWATDYKAGMTFRKLFQ